MSTDETTSELIPVETREPSNADLAREFVIAAFDEITDGQEVDKQAFLLEVNEASDDGIILMAESIRAKQKARSQKSRVIIHKPETNWKRRMR